MTVDDEEVLFTTPRSVVVRRWREVDLEPFGELNADRRVMAHLSGPLTRAQSDAFARYGESRMETEGIGLLPVRRRQDGTFLGMCGMHRHRWFPDQVEVGWRFAPTAWGRGYATEAAQGWLRHGFVEVGLTEVISITGPANRRSLAVMCRLGLVLIEATVRTAADGAPVDVVVHGLARESWRAAAKGSESSDGSDAGA